MIVNVTRRYNTPGYVLIEEDHNRRGRLFMSSPNILSLTEPEARALAQGINTMITELWDTNETPPTPNK